MNSPLVLFELDDLVVILTLNHPEKRNPLSRAMLTCLKEHLDRISGDSRVRVVIIRAAGPAFSAGHDLRELVAGSEHEYALLLALDRKSVV